MSAGTILWWGRFDPDYSRNRVLRRLLETAGWTLRDFRPRLSPLGAWEAGLRGMPRPDLVWVPCFRQRDLAAAHAWCRRRGVPLLADPLISAYDKQVFERRKLAAASRAARRLRDWEARRLALADCVLADTTAHAAFFRDELGVADDRLFVVPVGAEEDHFTPQLWSAKGPEQPLEVLFYGSFIPLQGPQTIVAAARAYQGPPVTWTLLGEGPLLDECRTLAAGLDTVHFEGWLPYQELPQRIGRADILLGIFGTTAKAARVIPNKVYQALACGRPLVTMDSPAYPEAMRHSTDAGISWVPAGDAAALAQAVSELAGRRPELPKQGAAALAGFREYFSMAYIERQLMAALASLGLPHGQPVGR